MAICETCGRDRQRALGPYEETHLRTSDALDDLHLRRGAEHISVDVTRAGRLAMNRIARATGMRLSEQIRQALDVWLPRNHA